MDESSRAYYQPALDGNFPMTELQQNQIENHPTSVYSYPHSSQTGTGFPMAELQPAQVDARQVPASMYYAQPSNFNMPHHFQSAAAAAAAAAANQAENRQIYYSSIGQQQSAEFLMNPFQTSQVDHANRLRNGFYY